MNSQLPLFHLILNPNFFSFTKCLKPLACENLKVLHLVTATRTSNVVGVPLLRQDKKPQMAYSWDTIEWNTWVTGLIILGYTYFCPIPKMEACVFHARGVDGCWWCRCNRSVIMQEGLIFFYYYLWTFISFGTLHIFCCIALIKKEFTHIKMPKTKDSNIQ